MKKEAIQLKTRSVLEGVEGGKGKGNDAIKL